MAVLLLAGCSAAPEPPSVERLEQCSVYVTGLTLDDMLALEERFLKLPPESRPEPIMDTCTEMLTDESKEYLIRSWDACEAATRDRKKCGAGYRLYQEWFWTEYAIPEMISAG